MGGCQSDITAAGTQRVHERWYEAQSGQSWARPAVSATIVYFGTGDGQIIARDMLTGTPRWITKVGPDAIDGANLLLRNGVVVAPVLNYTAGLDAQTGQQRWRYEAPKDTTGSPPGAATFPGQVILSRIDADDQTVYIPAWGASVSAVDLKTGAVRWIWQPGQIAGDTAVSGVFRSGSMSVRVSGDTVFATMWHDVNRQGGTSEAWVVALDRLTGHEFWRVRLPYQGSGALIEGAPVTFANLVIVHTVSARTYAIDRTTQRVAWEFTVPAAALSTIAEAELLGDVVYVDGGDRNIYALRAADGSVLWSAPFPTQATRDMLVTARRVTFTEGRTLYVLDRLTGKQITAVTQPRTTDPLFASPAAFANGQVFITVAGAAWCFDEP
jgi:outer membrane protein assembly factor BamB